MASVVTFVASLFVAILAIPFARYQSALLESQVRRAKVRTRSGRRLRGQIYDDPAIPRSHVEQSLEVAYGFPAAVLTVVAFGELFEWASLAAAVLVVVTAVWAVLTVLIVQPNQVGRFLSLRIGKISFYGLVIIAANVVGVCLATAQVSNIANGR